MQTKIDNWFLSNKLIQRNLSSSNLSDLSYFYLHCEKNMYTGCWKKELPCNCQFQKEIKWKKKGTITLCSNLFVDKDTEIQNTKIQDTKIQDTKNRYIPILKSNLQKCIRRSDTENALKTAKTMCTLNFLEFIRRLSIIMLEDAVLHESFMVLSWLIAAYPEYKPSINQVQWIYGIVKYLADLPFRDNYSYLDTFSIKDLYCDNLSEKHLSILYSLQFRSSYGGLKGDMKMIHSLTDIWKTRMLSNNTDFLLYLTNTIKFPKTKYKNILKTEINTAAVDFHCYPKMLSILHTRFPEYSVETLQKTIWYHRSRNTNKKLLEGKDSYCNEYIEIWTLIEEETEKISKIFLQRI